MSEQPNSAPTPSMPFFADEFFADPEDLTMTVTLTVAGREVPIEIKRHLCAEDRLRAELDGVEIAVVDGKAQVVKQDMAAASLSLAARAIVRWPFVVRETGAMLPVTVANLKRLKASVDPILAALNSVAGESAKALDPSATPSDAA